MSNSITTMGFGSSGGIADIIRLGFGGGSSPPVSNKYIITKIISGNIIKNGDVTVKTSNSTVQEYTRPEDITPPTTDYVNARLDEKYDDLKYYGWNKS